MKHNNDIFTFYDTKTDYSHLLKILEEGKKVLVFSPSRGNISVMKKDGNKVRFWRSDAISSSNDIWDLSPWSEKAVELFGRQKTFTELCEECKLQYIEPTR